MNVTTHETRFASSILAAKIVSPQSETFESRGKRGMKIFSPPTHANHSDAEAELLAAERESDPDEHRMSRVRAAYRGHANQILHEAVAKLSKRRREVIELRLEGYSTAQIASKIRISETTVRRTFQDAKKALRESSPEWRELFPLDAFTHSVDPREGWIEYNTRDNRREKFAGSETPDDLIEDRSEWSDKHGDSPEVKDLARFSRDGQRRIVVPLDLHGRAESTYVPEKQRSAQGDDESLSKEHRKLIAEACVAFLVDDQYELRDVVARLKPLLTQARQDALTPELADAAVAEVLKQHPGDDFDVRLALKRANALWNILRKRFEDEKPARLQVLAKDRKARQAAPHTASGPAPRTEAMLKAGKARLAHIRGAV
jgi:RNA polymerase sigma factor (sigma-70 family)